jgi:hypothetical protein
VDPKKKRKCIFIKKINVMSFERIRKNASRCSNVSNVFNKINKKIISKGPVAQPAPPTKNTIF